MSQTKKKAGFFDIFKNARHYRMEQFTILVVVLVLAMSVITGVCFQANLTQQSEMLSSRAMYNKSFRTSLTDISGSVQGVYSSNDKTKAFVLFKFSDINNISTDARQYKAFLTCAPLPQNKLFMNGTPAGSIYTFGTSGYMGVYLVNQSGFQPQVLSLTVRSLKPLKSTDTEGNSKLAEEDPTFKNNDQFCVYFNPGADEAKSIPCLNMNEVPSVKDLFDQTVAVDSLKEYNKALREDLSNMASALNRIDEYTNRLAKQDSVQVPDAPSCIKGDRISVKHNSRNIEDDSYRIHFESVVNGGYDFNWQAVKVGDNILRDVMRKEGMFDMTPEQYFAKKVAQRHGSGDSNPLDDITNMQWRLNDGTPVESLNTGTDTGRYSSIQSDIQNLINAWQEYLRYKTQYQTTDLEKVLNLSSMSNDISDSAIVNSTEKALRVY